MNICIVRPLISLKQESIDSKVNAFCHCLHAVLGNIFSCFSLQISCVFIQLPVALVWNPPSLPPFFLCFFFSLCSFLLVFLLFPPFLFVWSEFFSCLWKILFLILLACIQVVTSSMFRVIIIGFMQIILLKILFISNPSFRITFSIASKTKL